MIFFEVLRDCLKIGDGHNFIVLKLLKLWEYQRKMLIEIGASLILIEFTSVCEGYISLRRLVTICCSMLYNVSFKFDQTFMNDF